MSLPVQVASIDTAKVSVNSIIENGTMESFFLKTKKNETIALFCLKKNVSDQGCVHAIHVCTCEPHMAVLNQQEWFVRDLWCELNNKTLVRFKGLVLSCLQVKSGARDWCRHHVVCISRRKCSIHVSFPVLGTGEEDSKTCLTNWVGGDKHGVMMSVHGFCWSSVSSEKNVSCSTLSCLQMAYV